MNKDELLKKLDDLLVDWKDQHRWGLIELEVHDGEIVMMRQEIKEKFIQGHKGGYSHVRREER